MEFMMGGEELLSEVLVGCPETRQGEASLPLVKLTDQKQQILFLAF
jgi:hypothetical protein